MGFLNKAKASLSNAGNYTSQKADEASFNSKISEQKKLKTEAIEGAGQKMFDLYMHGTYAIDDEIKELFEKAVACDVEIERLEAEKADMIAKYENERQERRDKVAAEEEKEKAERAAAKAAEKEKSE
ncbi:MAG: hypothetical protein MJZ21_04135 [archaeon]|nr:hypothetical protein [archaeon]